MTPLITAVLGFALVGLLVVAVAHWRARRTITSMSTLLMGGEHERVLAHRAPPKAYRPVADRLRATSALLTGRNELALRLLDKSAVPSSVTDRVGDLDLHLRAGALVAMGRYADAAAALGDDPSGAIVRHQRAQVAIETGDDATALRLLAVPDAEPDEEAGRLRILGDLHIRRGRLAEGEALVRQARSAYAVSTMAAREVDTGYCHHHLGEAALARRNAAGALAQLTTALALLSVRPDNAPGLAAVHARLAEAYALSGDPRAAQEHLGEALQRGDLVGSPSLTTSLAKTQGVVALHLGRLDDARRHLNEAHAGHVELGELPAAAEVAELLADLDGAG